MPRTLKAKDSNLTDWARQKSIEDFEKEKGITLPKKLRHPKRFGYPKSNFYKIISAKTIKKNRKIVDNFLSISS